MVKKSDEVRVLTGISGLDKHLDGGLVPGSVNLISGSTGTGKSIFCMQFLCNGAKMYGERGLYITMEETDVNLKADVKSLGIDFSDLKDFVRFIYIPLFDIRDFDSILQKHLVEFKPQRVVIDSISALTMPLQDDYERKKEIYKLNQLLKSSGCTSMIISEVPSDSNTGAESLSRFSRFGIEEFLCDSIFFIYYKGVSGEGDRNLRIVKTRGSDHTRSPIVMSLAEGGMKITSAKK